MDFENWEAMFLNICLMYRMCKRKQNRRRWKVRPLNADYYESGYHRKVFLKMQAMDSEQFFKQTRMSPSIFQLLSEIVKNKLWKPRQRISPEERLAITLHFLAHGVCIQSLAWAYKLGRTTIRNIILETCEVLWRLLSPVYVSEPSQQQYKEIAKDFRELWNMPNCVGAIDGIHIAIKCPPKSGSLFFNYKKFSSIVLMAVSDAKYTFTAVSVGSYGSQSDGGILKSCPFGEALIANKLPLPPMVPLSESRQPFPHFFVGDAAFPLKSNIMRPYPSANLDRKKSIFNYRLSRARRCIENTFGILTARWRILRTAMEFNAENSETITLACIALHKFIMLNDHARWYCPERYVDWEDLDHVVQNGIWREDINKTDGHLRPILSFARRATATAFQLRDELADYFLNEEAVPFQDAMISNVNRPN